MEAPSENTPSKPADAASDTALPKTEALSVPDAAAAASAPQETDGDGPAEAQPESSAAGAAAAPSSEASSSKASSSKASSSKAQASTAQASEPAGSAALVPSGQVRQESQKTSFWKRIRLRGRAALDPATQDDRMIARLDAIASRIETSEQHLGQRIRDLDEHLSEVWEVEEQLSRLMELREMTEDLQERQGRIDGRLRGLERRLSFLTLLAATAALAGVSAVAVAFL